MTELCATTGCKAGTYAKGFCRSCYARDYRRRNVERTRENGQRYYQANKEKWAERHKTPARVAYMREYREKHRERLREARLAWGRANPDGWRERRLRTKFGLTLAQYEEMERRQGGLCAICGKRELSRDGRRLAVDHCHRTGRVRALLCSHCNRHLGWVEEHLALVQAMFGYMADHREPADVV